MSKKLDRRSFLKGATATAAASSLGFPALVNAG
ncbi:MAG: twin-arginine translocation signal domain-containing protein, partial [Litorivicinaceae bacterium]